jgi:hypothetical protein
MEVTPFHKERLDHLDQKCTFDEAAEAYRAKAREMEELRNDA